MKPIKLEFQGIKSYTDKTVIDFTKLTSSGIFGIFGNTGSGKSTILDCILLALYGRLPKTNKASEFLNFHTQNGYVEFTFSMHEEGISRVYLVRHEFKLKENRQPSSHKAFLVEIADGSKIPLAEGADNTNEKIEEIIGLKLDDFKKCIVLPQGEFSAFVTMASSGRLMMMSSLFNLDKYGEQLRFRVNRRNADLNTRIQVLNGKLENYSTDTEEELEKLQNEIENTNKEKVTLDVNYSKIKDKYLKNEKNYDTHKKVENCKRRLEELNKLQSVMLKKRKSVEKYNVAKQALSLCNKKRELESLITAEKKKSDKEIAIQKLIEEREKLLEKSKIDMGVYDQELVVINSQLLLLESVSSDIESINVMETKLVKLRLERTKLNNDKLRLEERLDSLNDSLNKYKSDYESKNFKQDVSALLSKIENSSDNGFLLSELDFLKSVFDLSDGVVKAIVRDRIEYVNNLLNKGDKYEIRTLLKELTVLFEENDVFLKNIQKRENEIAELNSKLDNLKVQIANIDEKGVSLKAEYDKTQEKINKILSGKNYEEFKNAILKRKDFIEKEKSKVLAEEKKLIEDKTKNVASVQSLTAKIQTLDKQLESINKEYDEILQNNFESESEINKIYALVGDNFHAVNSEVENYFNEVYLLNEQINQFSAEIAEDGFNMENYESVKAEYKNLDNKLSDLNNILYNLRKTYEKKSQNFEKRCIIENDKRALEKEFSLNSQLSDALKSNALLSFVAEEYLKEIAQIAKITLLTLTDGRFGLCYDKDFYVEDNVLGGQIRTVNTVSGGELFLVSLSLALALSKSIYSKSQKPIEFFFLDEGFGSLDKDLVETVMDCLNKLKEEQLTIGVISHVESLKDRIGAKILVTPSSEVSGSKVTII